MTFLLRPSGRALIVLIAASAALAVSAASARAYDMFTAQAAVVAKIERMYGPAAFATRAQCRPLTRKTFRCYFVASSHGLRKAMNLVGDADVTYRRNRPRVKLTWGPKCSGPGCPSKKRRD